MRSLELFLLTLAACSNAQVIDSSQEDDRGRELTAGFLRGDDPLEAPVSMQAFSPAAGSAEPTAEFSGTLALENPRSEFATVFDLWDRVTESGAVLRELPRFDIDLVQRGGDLVPLQRGVLRREHPYWELIVQPGSAWSDPQDGGWTRAALPFSLQERSANCVHNGVMTWLYDAAGNVTRAAYQVSSETCGYLKFDLWGTAEIDYQARDLSSRAQGALARLDAHRAARLPVRPLDQLGVDYPGIDTPGIAVDDGIPAADLSLYGFVVDGIHYRSDCATRRGPYPFCDALPLPSYSTAKSIFAGIAAMRFEKLYPGSLDRLIAELVPDCDSRRWRDVSLRHALNMVTGNYRSAAHEVDELSEASRDFVFADRHDAKVDFACRHFPRRAEPGTRFVYHSSDTYLLGTALQQLLRNERDGGGDIYRDLLAEPIWSALELSPLLDDAVRTYDQAAQPYTGYGLTYEADDVLRIAAWLMDGAELQGKAMLDSAMLTAALQRDAADRGHEAVDGSLRYSNGFWAYDSGPSLGCESEAWTPFMSGVSGITVAMFPNDVIYYYFSDSYVFRWQSGRVAANRIRELCQ